MDCSGYPRVIPPVVPINPIYTVTFEGTTVAFSGGSPGYMTPNSTSCPGLSGSVLTFTPVVSPINILSVAGGVKVSGQNQDVPMNITLADGVTVVGTVRDPDMVDPPSFTSVPASYAIVPASPGSLNNISSAIAVFANVSGESANGCYQIQLSYQKS